MKYCLRKMQYFLVGLRILMIQNVRIQLIAKEVSVSDDNSDMVGHPKLEAIIRFRPEVNTIF